MLEKDCDSILYIQYKKENKTKKEKKNDFFYMIKILITKNHESQIKSKNVSEARYFIMNE